MPLYKLNKYLSTSRATLTGTNDTLSGSQMTTALTQWLTTDGTFLYKPSIPIRLRADPDCKVEIEDFSDEECGGKECHEIKCQ